MENFIKSCENCGNAVYDVSLSELKCQLQSNLRRRCFTECYSMWEPKGDVTGIINAEIVATEVAGMIYKNGKAKIFNVLESQVEGQKLSASKRIVEDILSNISKMVADYIKTILGDWKIEVTAGGELTPEEEKEAAKEWQEIDEITCYRGDGCEMKLKCK